MSQASAPQASAPSPLPLFPSLVSLRAAHNELLKQYRAARQSPEFLPQIEAFINRARDSGALIDSDADRQNAQSLLDYWVTVLYQANRPAPDATLADFDLSQAPELRDEDCPYVGLSAFKEADHNLFFGRETLVQSILNRIANERMVAVFGASGSGKSSLILGGVVPAMKLGAVVPHSETWHYFPTIVPGSHPLDNLAAAVSANAADFKNNREHFAELARQTGKPCVLVIDQFEELFTLSRDEDERVAFVTNLRSFIDEAAHTNTVLITMRSDFEDQVVLIPELSAFFVKAEHVTALGALELRAAIEKPAARVGLKFDDGIVDDLVKEVLGQPAGLPLLQFALFKLWQNRERNRITRTAYRKLGNVRAALGASADALYNSLLLQDQTVLKRIMLRLVRPSEGLEVTSNRVRVSSLSGLGGNVNTVLTRLLDARLLRLTKGETSKDDQVEVAHEALVRNWPLLVEWLDEERQRLRTRLRLTAAAELWDQHDRDPGGLLGGSLLTEAAAYDDLNDLEREFVEASKALALQAEKDRERARRREEDLARQAEIRKAQKIWIQRLYVFIGVLTIILAITAGLFWWSYRLVQINAALLAGQTAGQLKASNQDNSAVLLSIYSFRRAWYRDATLHGLIDSYVRDALGISFSRSLHNGTDRITSLAVQPDSKSLVFGDEKGKIWIGDLAQLNFKNIATADSGIVSVAFSSDSALASLSNLKGPSQVQLHTPEGKVLLNMPNPGSSSFVAMAAAHTQPVLALAADDGSVSLWNWKEGTPPKRLAGKPQNVVTLDFSGDDSMLAGGGYDKTVQIWNTGDPKEPPTTRKVPDFVNTVSFSADGALLAAGTQSGILLWDLQNPTIEPRTFLAGESVLSVRVFSDAKAPANDLLLAGLYSGEVTVVSKLNAPQRTPLSRSDYPINSIAFQDDGQVAYSGSSDGSVKKISRIKDPQPLAGALPLAVSNAVFEPGSRELAVMTDNVDQSSGTNDARDQTHDDESLKHNSSIYVFELDGANLKLLHSLTLPKEWVKSLVFADEGDSVVFGNSKGAIFKRFEDKTEFVGNHGSEITAVAAALSGTLIASSGTNGKIQFWKKPGCVSGLDSAANLLALSVHAQWLAAADGASVKLWNLADCSKPRMVQLLPSKRSVRVTALSLSAEGHWLAAALEKGYVLLWDFDKPQQEPIILRPSGATQDDATSLAFGDRATHSKLLAVGYHKGGIHAWNIEHPDAKPFTWNRHSAQIAAIAFVNEPDGTGGYSIDSNFTAFRWLSTPALVEQACNLTKDLRPEQWKGLIGKVPEQQVCPTH